MSCLSLTGKLDAVNVEDSGSNPVGHSITASTIIEMQNALEEEFRQRFWSRSDINKAILSVSARGMAIMKMTEDCCGVESIDLDGFYL